MSDYASRRSSAVVLVLDDDATIQDLLARMLRVHGFAPKHAVTVADAVWIAEREQVDAAIIDISLRRQQSGLDFLTWLRLQPAYADIPVIVFTGQAQLSADEQALVNRNRAAVFYKPQPFAALIDYLKRLTGRTG